MKDARFYSLEIRLRGNGYVSQVSANLSMENQGVKPYANRGESANVGGQSPLPVDR